MVKIGMMIGERYEILEKIGTGGMSDVYKAKCHKLNRYVAVKVLKQEFSENENFVSKFRIEAQAAAGLMHPNIVNVYDVGEENGIYYIVMELVEGITLKKYIEKKARLSYKEAVSIAIQVSMGIEAAHNNHIIHRDIKPQNIIISKDGKVKVTDFGIAKAATSNTITSNVMGSVHYTSPEQARGGYSDEKSDIYSLGITMFEMLTGRVPFNGETTVAIAIKHIQEEMPSPKEYVPEIPGSVEGIVIKCCQKSPDRRYQNMQEVIADLKHSLINPDEDFVVMNDPDMAGGTQMISEDDRSRIKRRSGYPEEREPVKEDTMRLRGEPLRGDTSYNMGGQEPGEYDEEYEEEDDFDYNPKMERVTTILTILAGIIICIIIIVLAMRIFRNMNQNDGKDNGPIITTEEPASTEQVNYVAMPAVAGTGLEEARKALTDLGLIPDLVYEESDTVESGMVISADTAAGTQLKTGTTVKLTVSSGTQGIEVPEVSGKTFEEANSTLIGLELLVNKAEAYSDTIAEGTVISQMPQSGNKVPKGSVITVTVSLGKQESKVYVPNLIGLLEEDGVFAVIEQGLEIGTTSYVYSSEVAEGYICYQSYSHGSYVDAGTKIDIRVSQGPEAVTYKCNMNIEAPTIQEAPDYVSGTTIHIVFTTDDGKVLLETDATGFPQAANYYGLTASGGTITMTYTVTTAGTTTIDPETGEMVNIPGESEQRSFTRRVEFVRE